MRFWCTYEIEVVGSRRFEDALVRNVTHEHRPAAQVHQHEELEDVEARQNRCVERTEPETSDDVTHIVRHTSQSCRLYWHSMSDWCVFAANQLTRPWLDC